MIVGKVWGRQQLCSLTLCRTTNITQHQRAALSVPKWKYVHLFSTVCVREAVLVLVARRSDSHLGSKALLVALSNAAAFVQRRAQSTLTAVISFALHCAPNITLLYSSSIQNIPCQRKMRSIYNALRQSVAQCIKMVGFGKIPWSGLIETRHSDQILMDQPN